ncbi:MAG: hypothetical protein K8J08_09275 [Thermoanaerobaculia bacterium]|nr:hypothetical protein [Thermoanaerobaculia bacterium]
MSSSARGVVSNGFLSQRFETPALGIALELTIPDLGVEVEEPLTKRP